jgi:hypothetical protein
MGLGSDTAADAAATLTSPFTNDARKAEYDLDNLSHYNDGMPATRNHGFPLSVHATPEVGMIARHSGISYRPLP